MASTLVFSASEDEILIQEVQKNSVLFNIGDKNYKNIILKDNIWKDISLKLGKSVDVTKKRWKNIRDSYSRNKRKPSTGSAASIKKKWTLAPHLGFLEQVECERSSTSNVTQTQELDTSNQDHDTSNQDHDTSNQDHDTSNQDLDTTHLVEDKNEECYETDDNAPRQTFSKERGPTKNKMADLFIKRSNERNLLIKKIQDQNEQILMKQNNQLDDMDLFFKSLALTAKKFPSQGKREAKVRIFALMAELEEKYSAPEQPIHSFRSIGQLPHVHVPQEDQSPASFQETTTSTSFAESSCSQFSTFNYDDSTA